MTDQQTTAPTRERAEQLGEGSRVLDRYRFEERLGRGGHGTVWRAFDERLEREVAVKAIPRGTGDDEPRVEREARIAARLNHPGIVALYELGSDADATYLVSELVHGRTMAELGRAGALSDRDVAGIGSALAAALTHAHDQGIVHRDVKPHNVIVVAEPAAGAGFAKLTDFGVAQIADDLTLTRTGDVVGTLAYMAPEQAEEARVTAAADVYSLALTLYEGFTGSGRESVIGARLAGRQPPPLARLRPDLPRSLAQTVDAALDPRPAARPPLAALERELQLAVESLSERGGLDEPATRRRFGIPSAGELAAGRLAARPQLPRWLLRAAAGIGAGALAFSALELPVATPPLAPLTAGAATAAAVALLPRLAWLAAAVCAIGWFVAPATELRGAALVVAAALAPVPLLLPRAGLAWSVPALAPLLGTAGLAALYPVLAGFATTGWRRAGLALSGFGALVAAELLSGERLLFGRTPEAPPPDALANAPLTAAREAVVPSLASLLPAAAAAWAALALVLPWLVRGRSSASDAAGAAVWTIAAIAVHGWLAGALASGPAGDAGLHALGAIGGGVAAFGWARLRARAGPSPTDEGYADAGRGGRFGDA